MSKNNFCESMSFILLKSDATYPSEIPCSTLKINLRKLLTEEILYIFSAYDFFKNNLENISNGTIRELEFV